MERHRRAAGAALREEPTDRVTAIVMLLEEDAGTAPCLAERARDEPRRGEQYCKQQKQPLIRN